MRQPSLVCALRSAAVWIEFRPLMSGLYCKAGMIPGKVAPWFWAILLAGNGLILYEMIVEKEKLAPLSWTGL